MEGFNSEAEFTFLEGINFQVGKGTLPPPGVQI